MPEPIPADLASRSFRSRLRGWDPDEVQAYLAEVDRNVRELTVERDRLAARVAELGAKDLKQEFETVGREVASVLEAAREAAESMRARAGADASRWRSEAVAEAEGERRRARTDAETLRGDAWTTAEELLRQSQAEAQRILVEAEKEAMRQVGQAELETHRAQAQARRESEEIVRSARMEAEKLLLDAQSRHDQLLEASHRQAEAAQERARALEGRRQELGKELESLREALTRAETELDEKREAMSLSPPTPDDAEPAPPEWPGGDTVRVVRPAGGGVAGELGSVRRLDGDRDVPQPLPEIKVIPAAELAKRAGAGPAGPKDPKDSPIPPPAAVETAEVPPEVAGAEPEPAAEPTTESQAVAEPAPETAVPEPAGEEPEPSSGTETGTATDETDVPEPPPAPPEPVHGDILTEDVIGIFDRLRHSDQPTAEPSPAPSPQAVESEPPSAPRKRRQPATDLLAIREQRLLPITNRSLRNLKRQLTDEANVALDEIRSAEGDWQPDETGLAERLRADLVVLAAESFGAGHGTAEELIGERVPRPSTPKMDPDAVFAGHLVRELKETLEEGKAAGHGPHQLGTVVSRLFRAWRTDEAERRVRSLALSAFHQGLGVTLTQAGRPMALVVAGKGCATCRAAAEEETSLDHLPPFHGGCECMVAAGSV
jgi:cell division septum initiation protein DivIVA